MAPRSEVQFHAATDVGRKRPHNEDNFLVDHELGLFIVADGMGGHAAGEVASAIAVRTVHEALAKHRAAIQDRAEKGASSTVTAKQLLDMFAYAVQCASMRIHAEAERDREKRGMGTTLSALLLQEPHGYIAHVGDSRIYLARGGGVYQITADHTVANELVRMGMVTPDKLEHIPRKNAITRAVGVYERADVDTLTIEVLPDDVYLLASDGLHGYFEAADEVVRLLAERDLERAVRQMIDFANAKGGKDNITAVLVRIGAGDEAERARRACQLELKHDVLARMPLFCRLDERQLLRVMQVADVCPLAAGDAVVRQGERGDALFIVLTGRLEVSAGQAVLSKLGPGDHFGEMALIRSVPRSATVTAVEPSDLLVIKREDFFDIIRYEPLLAVKLLWQFLGVLADRLEETSRELSVAVDELTADGRAGAEDEEQAVEIEPLPDEEAADPFAAPREFALRLGFADAKGTLPLDEPTGPGPRDSAAPPAPPDAERSRLGRVVLRSPGGTAPPGEPVPAAAAEPAMATAAEPAEVDPEAKRKTLRMDAVEPPPEGAGEGKQAPPGDAPASAPAATPAAAAGAEQDKKTAEVTTQEPETARRPGFVPVKQTLPLDGDGELQKELQQLREQFRERRRKRREGEGG